jgi:hypothetical protein
MNSDLMPTEPSNSTASNLDETQKDATTEKPTSEEANSVTSSETAQDENLVNRQQPIPPPSEPMQYRAIGLVRGRYAASEEQFTQGFLVTPDAAEIDAVLLGRIMSLVKNHLDLEQEHLWVVYPRTRQENDKLHLQIVGVWEPEKLAKSESEVESQESELSGDESKSTATSSDSLTPSSEIPDGGFSVRGEVVYQSPEGDSLVIKIKQAPRKNDDKPKYFKLKLKGNLNIKAVGKFWDLQVKREADFLTIETGEAIADLPKKRRPSFSKGGPGGGGGGGGRRPFNRGSAGGGVGGGGKKPFRKPSGAETPRPIKKGSDATGATPRPAAPNPSRPTPKPVKRPKPEE